MMGLRDEAKQVAAQYKNSARMLEDNERLLKIQEGELLQFVEQELQKQLSAAAFEVCRHRIPPINIQRRVVDKLSQIYFKPPTRTVAEGTESDIEMWDNYIKMFCLDVSGQTMNEYFNLMKSCAWQPYLDQKFKPKLREIPKDRFFVMGLDPTDPLRVTHFVQVMGYELVETKDPVGKITGSTTMRILYVYTDTEFLIIYDNGDVAEKLMADKALNGGNPYGRIPFVYLNRSKTNINAPSDSDMYRMATLIPCLFADLNYALMFQAFSIWYGINVDATTLPIAPNAFVNLKANQDNPGVEPKIGVIKPEVDSDKALTAITEQLSLWLQSRGIRPGTVGRSQDQSLTGVSKMVDEMDTTADRNKQIPFFVDAEEQLFDLITNFMHPTWSRNASFLEKRQFSKELGYEVKFAEQIGIKTRLEVIQELQAEKNLGIVSTETALKRANPEMKEDELTAEMAKIQKEQQAVSDQKAKEFAARAPFGG